jgi:hypothetical protein
MNNAQSDAGATEIYDNSDFTPGSSMEKRIADLLVQQNDLLRKIVDVLEKFAIGYRVLMSVENRVEDIEKWRQTALIGRG